MPCREHNDHAGLHGMRFLPSVVAALLVVSSCGEKERSYVDNVGDGDHSPTMTTVDVETFISDSGYTRYHLSTPLWMMYEEAREPFWRFPEGLDLQQYDLAMNPAATMECDSATYFSRKRLWRLDGHVVMVNTLRDSFLSQQLYWDQVTRKVYTDSFIHIVRSDRIVEGYGFVSNENMTSYEINRPTAILPVERSAARGRQAEADSLAEDSMTAARRPRRQAVRRVDKAQEPPGAVTPAIDDPLPLRHRRVPDGNGDGNQRIKPITKEP